MNNFDLKKYLSEGKLTEDIPVEEMESFAEGRGEGAETIADNAKEKELTIEEDYNNAPRIVPPELKDDLYTAKAIMKRVYFWTYGSGAKLTVKTNVFIIKNDLCHVKLIEGDYSFIVFYNEKTQVETSGWVKSTEIQKNNGQQ